MTYPPPAFTLPPCMNTSPSSPPQTSRRTFLIHLAALTALPTLSHLPASAAPATGRSIVNSVLSAYGLPTLRDVSGFTPLVEQYDRLVVEFQYPSAWIVQRNVLPVSDDAGLTQANGRMSMGGMNAPMEGRSSGLTVGDYRKAEGLSFYVDSAPKGVNTVERVNVQFIADLVTPGDATGSAPNARVIEEWMDAEGYRWIETKYESITGSGYIVARKARAKATVLSDGKLYALTASCTENRWKKVAELLDTALHSFHVYKV